MKLIDEMYAFVYTDDQGDEGIPAMLNHNLWLPLVGADMARIESLMPQARLIAQQMGKSLKILRFSVREQIGEVNP